MRLITILFFLFISLSAETSLYDKGKGLYFEKACNGCHGTKAEGMTNYPSLANRAKGFLAYKLKTYRKGIVTTQAQQMMIAFAQPLSDDDIDALSTFLHEYKDEQKEHYNPEYETWGDGGS
ncbi:MAG: c-type cytochrome [Campylobacterota bacterium]|nr:c-type cytochrome [Campylobacterota bacterium]